MSKQTRRRYRLHKWQGGKCYYCHDPIGILLEHAGSPVLEHFIPESAGGTYSQTVLACGACDKAKGMIPGPEFQLLIAGFMVDGQPITSMGRVFLTKAAKQQNRELQEVHPPRIQGEANAKIREERRKALISGLIVAQ